MEELRFAGRTAVIFVFPHSLARTFQAQTFGGEVEGALTPPKPWQTEWMRTREVREKLNLVNNK